MKRATGYVTSRDRNVLSFGGCDLVELGVRAGASVRIAHLDDPTQTPWEFKVDGAVDAAGEIRGRPPDWLQAGTPIVLEVEPPAPVAPRSPPAKIVLTHALTPEHLPNGPVLAVGVDVTWWGGSPVNPSSQTETIAWAYRDENGAWGEFGFERVDLAGAPTKSPGDCDANADADAALLWHRIMAVIAGHPETRVILALDAPLIAQQRPALPPRARRYPAVVGEEQPDTGEALAKLLVAKKLAFRACELALREQVERSRVHWRSIYLQPGAPIPPRVAALVQAMRESGFATYTDPAVRLPPRIAFECFPNEALWATDVLSNAYEGFTFRQARLYKRMDEISDVWPRSVVRAVTRECLGPIAALVGLVDARLFDALDAWLDRDPLVATGSRARRVGKIYDDVLDSVIALLTAIALASGRAHVHIGAPADGHIIGPGRQEP